MTGDKEAGPTVSGGDVPLSGADNATGTVVAPSLQTAAAAADAQLRESAARWGTPDEKRIRESLAGVSRAIAGLSGAVIIGYIIGWFQAEGYYGAIRFPWICSRLSAPEILVFASPFIMLFVSCFSATVISGPVSRSGLGTYWRRGNWALAVASTMVAVFIVSLFLNWLSIVLVSMMLAICAFAVNLGNMSFVQLSTQGRRPNDLDRLIGLMGVATIDR